MGCERIECAKMYQEGVIVQMILFNFMDLLFGVEHSIVSDFSFLPTSTDISIACLLPMDTCRNKYERQCESLVSSMPPPPVYHHHLCVTHKRIHLHDIAAGSEHVKSIFFCLPIFMHALIRLRFNRKELHIRHLPIRM